jgi:hypothetical protein
MHLQGTFSRIQMDPASHPTLLPPQELHQLGLPWTTANTTMRKAFLPMPFSAQTQLGLIGCALCGSDRLPESNVLYLPLLWAMCFGPCTSLGRVLLDANTPTNAADWISLSGYICVQAALQNFTGASAISSSQYFGNGEDASRGDDLGGADEFMNRLSLQVRQDLNQVRNVASDVGRRLGDFVSNLNKY